MKALRSSDAPCIQQVVRGLQGVGFGSVDRDPFVEPGDQKNVLIVLIYLHSKQALPRSVGARDECYQQLDTAAVLVSRRRKLRISTRAPSLLACS